MYLQIRDINKKKKEGFMKKLIMTLDFEFLHGRLQVLCGSIRYSRNCNWLRERKSCQGIYKYLRQSLHAV